MGIQSKATSKPDISYNSISKYLPSKFTLTCNQTKVFTVYYKFTYLLLIAGVELAMMLYEEKERKEEQYVRMSSRLKSMNSLPFYIILILTLLVASYSMDYIREIYYFIHCIPMLFEYLYIVLFFINSFSLLEISRIQ